MVKVKEQHYSYQLYKQKYFAQEYEKDRFGSRFGQYLKTKEGFIYARMVPEYKRLIDVGAGTGKLAILLKQPNSFVVATDASLEMLRVAAQLAQQTDKKISLVVCDAHHLCFKNNSFDVAVSSRVLMHLVNWRSALSEYCRISRNSIILDFPYAASFTFFERVIRKFLQFFKTAQCYRAFWLKTVKTEYKKYGFKVVQSEKLYFLPIFLHRCMGRINFSEKLETFFARIGLTGMFGSPVILRVDATEEGTESDDEKF
ncbi:class I SAM-dependent methyltransferase [candidate division KSB1 bacterium]|nr:class I SAM-dependent methyltransferase [candidate division KSB1 bacterium]